MKRVLRIIAYALSFAALGACAGASEEQGRIAKAEPAAVTAPRSGSVDDTQVETVLVEGGSFPRDGFRISVSPFLIGRYEITQEQYLRLTGKEPSRFKGRARLPVEQVSWLDAASFCNELSKIDGLEPVYTIQGQEARIDHSKTGWRLPTEAEWEFAARGGTKSVGYTYAGGNDPAKLAWYVDNSGNSTQPVGLKEPNELGIYDMSGNVFEFCNDWYGDYPVGDLVDPVGPESGLGRVMRGGTFSRVVTASAVSFRTFLTQDAARAGAGFRVARAAP